MLTVEVWLAILGLHKQLNYINKMKNKEAVNAYLARKRKEGYRTLSLIVHKDDADAIRDLANQLKSKREKEMRQLTPAITVQTLNNLEISDNDFRQIHHLRGSMGELETVESHKQYLDGKKRYQRNRNNYVVAERIESMTEALQNGKEVNQAIKEAIELYRFYP